MNRRLSVALLALAACDFSADATRYRLGYCEAFCRPPQTGAECERCTEPDAGTAGGGATSAGGGGSNPSGGGAATAGGTGLAGGGASMAGGLGGGSSAGGGATAGGRASLETYCPPGSCDLETNAYILAVRAVCANLSVRTGGTYYPACSDNGGRFFEESPIRTALQNTNGSGTIAAYETFVDARFNQQNFGRWGYEFFSGLLQLPVSNGAFVGSVTAPLADLAATPTNERTVQARTAAGFMTWVLVGNVDATEIFARDAGTCLAAPSGQPVSCNTGATVGGSTAATAMGNNVPEGAQAGVLTDPGLLAVHAGPLGLRRARRFTEIFGCQHEPFGPGPAAYAAPPDGGVVFTGVRRTRGGTSTSIDTIGFGGGCQACHTTLHRHALPWLKFDDVGFRDPALPMVTVPIGDSPFVQRQELLALPDGGPAGFDAAALLEVELPSDSTLDLRTAALGSPRLMRCLVKRLYAHAMTWSPGTYGDSSVTAAGLVASMAGVPQVSDAEVDPHFTRFTVSGNKLKTAFGSILKSPEFIDRIRGCPASCPANQVCGSVSPRVCGPSSCSNGIE
ncbi:MAG: hypothetical protein JNK82_30280, partial [Myxococcaceae bacterium]|nr:hypothetical protein [Myxococcaceae bacterium]